ncbi:OB-fold-containig protein [Dysgonomonas sp. Marseille-P4361]|uniref:OB-fold-containig protein n=1 Tax=Dysgonomonas sp. Marseille-P4361 TaxID=2161820 RepID=UPI000D555E71|nr:OB-fold-containig protein [Dysgonomonas sp. Marseille-P4361]
MTDFLYNLMHPLPNAIMTVIVGVTALYWLFAFISGVGVDALDIDLDFDFDTDIDTDVDIDTDIDSDIGKNIDIDTDSNIDVHPEPSVFMKFLNFMNVGKVPFMLLLSTLKFFMWIITLFTTSMVNVTGWGLFSLLILLPIGIIGLFFTKLATNPLVKLFKEMGYKGEAEIDFLGRSGKMLSNIKDQKIGTAEFLVDKNPIKLNVVSIDGQELKYGDYVIVADESDDRRIYYVSKEISIRNMDI